MSVSSVAGWLAVAVLARNSLIETTRNRWSEASTVHCQVPQNIFNNVLITTRMVLLALLKRLFQIVKLQVELFNGRKSEISSFRLFNHSK